MQQFKLILGVKPNPNWLPMTLSFGALGPYTVELTQFSSTLIGHYIIFVFIKGGQMRNGFPCIQCLFYEYIPL
jgi:hypothetical protein